MFGRPIWTYRHVYVSPLNNNIDRQPNLRIKHHPTICNKNLSPTRSRSLLKASHEVSSVLDIFIGRFAASAA